jgi:hypothetical protein
MIFILIIAFIAWVLFCVSKAPDTDEGKVAALFAATWTAIALGGFAFGGLLLLAGVFA